MKAGAISITRETFESLAEDWRGLLSRSKTNTVFATLEWHETWWEVFGVGSELHLLRIKEDSHTIGIAPLRRNGDVFYLTGSEDLCDYLDLLPEAGKEDVVYETALDYLDRFPWQCLELRSVREGSPTLNGLLALARRRGHTVEQKVEEVCPAIDLPPTWDEYLSRLGKKDRHELRRKMRRLTETSDARCYAVTDTANFERDKDDFFRLLRLNEEKVEFMTPPRQRFFELMMRRFLDRGWLRLYFMEVGGERVSSVVCFDYGDEILLYNSGFDHAYSYLSVGLLLKTFCLKEAIEEGKKRYDFLRGREPYKYDLGGQDVPVYHVTIRRGGGKEG